MKQKNKGFTLIDLIFTMITVVLLVIILTPAQRHHHTRYKLSKCKANLTQIRTALTQYQLDLGRQVYYPPHDGGQFIAALYAEHILVEEQVYICPETKDIANGGQLADVVTGKILISTSAIRTVADAKGPLSYAGRINTSQDTYPGFFKLSQDISTTPMSCDDVADSNATGSENHEGGKVINVLFLDGHVDHIRRARGIMNDKSLFGVVTDGRNTGLLNPMAN